MAGSESIGSPFSASHAPADMQSTQPAFFKQGPKPLTRLLIFSLLSLALMVGDAHYQMLGRVREHVSVVLYPLQWLATAPFTLVREAGQFFTRQTELLAENKRLNDAQLTAAMQAMRLKQLEIENARLVELNEARRGLPQASQLAEVLYNGRDPFSARLIINRGERQGVQDGRIVADASGLVGQIVRVQPQTSEVRLLTDRGHLVPIVVERNQLRAVVYGMGRNLPLEVRNLSPNVDIVEGDKLLTSGVGGLYPAGLPVARVVQVDRQGAYARIVCEPVSGIEQHRFVLVLDAVPALPPYPAQASVPVAKSVRKGS